MASRQTEAGRVLADLAKSYGWGQRSLARRTGVSESLIRKYMNGVGSRPEVKYVSRIARAFGSRDGAKLLYAFGFDALAQELAKEDLPAQSPVEETPQPVDLDFGERLTRVEEMVERIFEELVSSGRDMPDQRERPAVVVDINRGQRRRRPPAGVSGWADRLSLEAQQPVSGSAHKAS